MENFLIVTLVKLLDPIGFVMVLLVSGFAARKWWAYTVAVLAAISIEMFTSSANHAIEFGDGLIPGIIASCIHASLIILARTVMAKTRRASAPSSADFDESDFQSWYSAVKNRAAAIKDSAVVEVDDLNILDLLDDAPARAAYKDKLSVEEYSQILAEHFEVPLRQ